MDLTFKGVKITGILSVLPSNEVSFDDELVNYNFPEKNSLKLKRLLGFDKRRIVDDNTCASDLCFHGMNFLLEQKLIAKEEIAALIFISLTPDYISPPTSNVLHGKLGLGNDVYCLDMNQGCAGFVIGLFNAFTLLNSGVKNKIVILNADTSSKIVSKHDRNTAPLFGDAAAITIVEKSDTDDLVFLKLKNDGTHADSLIIPAGGFRMRASADTALYKDYDDGNRRSLEHSHMKGDLVYNFTMNEVIDLINSMFEHSNLIKDSIDYFMFHQPNKFILQNMAKKLEISEEKMPNNIVGLFGNSNGAALPVNICYNLGSRLETEELQICLSAFGVGLSWNVMVMKMGLMNFCKIIEYP